MLVVCSDMHVLRSPLISVVVTKKQDFASNFAPVPPVLHSGRGYPSRTHPQPGLRPGAGRPVSEPKPWPPRFFSRGCALGRRWLRVNVNFAVETALSGGNWHARYLPTGLCGPVAACVTRYVRAEDRVPPRDILYHESYCDAYSIRHRLHTVTAVSIARSTQPFTVHVTIKISVRAEY